MVIKLSKNYPCIHGLPVIHSVDTDIFDITYYMDCMGCTFCNDQCCSYGADIDMLNVNRIMLHKDGLEKFTGIKSDKWFYKNKRMWDYEYPGHDYTRTSKKGIGCIFLNRKTRGCMLHSFALEKNMDYHDIKPFFCTLFPVTYNDGVLVTPEEIDEKSLKCLGEGSTLYRGARDEIKYYFCEELVNELDRIEKSYYAQRKSA